MESLFDKISLWWRFEAKFYHRDLISGIKNLIRWFPVIWKDRDWDDHFIWQVMIQKLKFQAKYIGNKDWHVNAKRDAEIMMTCVRLMEKIKDEYYGIEYIDYYEARFRFETTENPELRELKVDYISESLDDYFKKYPLVYKKVIKDNASKDKYIIAHYIGSENHNRARRILFALMERNIESWWN